MPQINWATLRVVARNVAAGNIGCMVQFGNHLYESGQALPLWHTVELLDRVCAGE